ncbi:MAG: hypothetical protein HKM93_00800 [Desulfobacteraceae bacterium]|nr:hypothetical protein [Desulfobacteraceae bacterium]
MTDRYAPAFKLIHFVMFIMLTLFTITGCGGGAGGSSSGPDSGTNSEWDTMVWDRDNWE